MNTLTEEVREILGSSAMYISEVSPSSVYLTSGNADYLLWKDNIQVRPGGSYGGECTAQIRSLGDYCAGSVFGERFQKIASHLTSPSIEQSLEDKVREMVRPFGNYPVEDCVSHISIKMGDTFRLIYKDKIEIVSHNGRVQQWCVDDMAINGAWCKLYKEISALLTPLPEPTLEETIGAMFEEYKKTKHKGADIPRISVSNNGVTVYWDQRTDFITANQFSYRHSEEDGYTQSIEAFMSDSDFTTGYCHFVQYVSEELKKLQPQSPTPHSDTADGINKLKARIEDLEMERDSLIEDAVKDSETIADLTVTNHRLLGKAADLGKNLDNYISQSRKDIEYANSRNDELRARVDVLTLEKRALEGQLQGSVSLEDHEQEMNAWEASCEELTKRVEAIENTGYTIRQTAWRLTIEL